MAEDIPLPPPSSTAPARARARLVASPSARACLVVSSHARARLTASPRARAALVAGLLALAGCTEPRGPAFEPAPETLALPRPAMVETASLRARRDVAGPDAERLAREADALAARGEALRGRATALGGPVVDPARRARLMEARQPAP